MAVGDGMVLLRGRDDELDVTELLYVIISPSHHGRMMNCVGDRMSIGFYVILYRIWHVGIKLLP